MKSRRWVHAMFPGHLRRRLGALVRDVPRFEWHLRRGAGTWVYVRNRDERLIKSDSRNAVRCDWRWTSELHVAKVFPSAGLRLMHTAFGEWPVRMREAISPEPGPPQVSFIIPHKGSERTPNLLLTLRSIAGQSAARVECIVVEQGPESSIAAMLPPWVTHLLLAPPEGTPFNKSWLLNCGVAAARADVVVLHDNDMIVPERWAAEIVALHAEGYDVIDPKRFIFYLDRAASARSFERGLPDLSAPPESVVQNLTAGGTMAIARRAYEEIGGYDETFYGWGGHDTEFWERAITRKSFQFGYLPLLHAWHASNPGKDRRDLDPGTRRYAELETVAVDERIAALRARPRGLSSGPVPGWQA